MHPLAKQLVENLLEKEVEKSDEKENAGEKKKFVPFWKRKSSEKKR